MVPKRIWIVNAKAHVREVRGYYKSTHCLVFSVNPKSLPMSKTIGVNLFEAALFLSPPSSISSASQESPQEPLR